MLEHVVDHARNAQDTQDAQHHLRGRLQAYLAIAHADDLDIVLRHIVEAARELVDARYAALGVVVEGRLARFVHTGMADEVVARIDHFPEGKGLLGLLVDHPRPLRLRDIADHAASIGFPANHPPMRSFLGVPVWVADRVFGNLYLTEKQGTAKQGTAEFTADDEDLVQALAAAAGAAIENATLLAESHRRQVWQTATMEITTGMLAGDDHGDALRRLVHHAGQILDAGGAGVSMPADDGTAWRMAVTDGSYSRWQDAMVPLDGSVTAAAIASGEVVSVADPATDPRAIAVSGKEAAGLVGETLAAPMRSNRGIIGVLMVSRHPGCSGFDQLDRDMIAAIAAHAGLALELAEVRRDNERLRLLEDREQIADDLLHQFIGRLFACGLALQGAACRTAKPELREALEAQVAELDGIIRDIRAAVFSHHSAPPEPCQSTEQPEHMGLRRGAEEDPRDGCSR